MGNNGYKFTSYNTLEHTYFHDCTVKKAELFNKNLFLYFDYIYAAETHPDNDSGRFKVTNNAMIRFDKIKIRKSFWLDMSGFISEWNEKLKLNPGYKIGEFNHDEAAQKKDIDFLDALTGLEIITLDIMRTRKKNICKIKGCIKSVAAAERFGSYVRVLFEYADALVCFD